MRSIQMTIIVMLISISQLFAVVSPTVLSTNGSQQQEKKITGKVTDKSGELLPGVTVLVVGTSIGTVTDANGNFSLLIPGNARNLSFSFIGMTTQEVSVADQTVFNVQLEVIDTGIEEVVVIGYGTARRKDLTGSVFTIDQAAIKNLPVTTIDQKLVGQTAGVQIQQATGAPGGGTLVKIRGTGSIAAGNDPLYVVDGIPYSANPSINLNPLAYINPNDIESISILKDASSTAIYGSRGSNGVIMITTKKGRLEKNEINFSAMVGIQTVPEKGRLDMFNAKEFAEYMQDQAFKRVRAWENREPTLDDLPVEYRYPDELGEGTNYYDRLLMSAPVQDYNLGVSTGTEKTQAYISLGYFNQQGVIKHTGLNRYSGNITIKSKIAKVLKVGASLMPTFFYQKRTSVGVGWGADPISQALLANPTVSPYDENGVLKPFLVSPSNKYVTPYSIVNPIFSVEETLQHDKQFRNVGSAFAEWEIIPDLKFKSSLSTIWTNQNYFKYTSSTVGSQNKPPSPGTGYSNTSKSNIFYWLIENTLTYNKTMGNHNFDALLGYTVEQNTSDGITLTAQPYPNDMIESINGAQAISVWSESFNQWAIISYLSRINYAYKDKYLLTATFRADGSSRFGSENRYAFFPSVAAAWTVSEEEFLRNANAIDYLKLRLSYGQSGNNNIGDYSALSSITAGQYIFGTTQVAASTVGISNPYLTWEESDQLDVGLDIALLKNRLSINLDLYNRKSRNMLLSDRIPAITGFNVMTINKGSIRNNGVEITLGGTPVSGAFKWDFQMNLAFNRNKVLELNAAGDRILSGKWAGYETHVTQLGEPMAQFFGYVLEGLLTAEDMANPEVPKDLLAHEGGNKYKDHNGDGMITDILDYTVIGNPWPDCIFGLSNIFTYKNFDLSIMMNGQIGGTVVDANRSRADFAWGKTNMTKEWINRWISAEQPGDGMHSGVSTGSENWTWKVSSMWVEQATFLRINNIKLGYTLPERLKEYARIFKNFNIYFTIQNLATFTTYRGANPEAQSSAVDETLCPGWDLTQYPLSRTTSFGINLLF